MLDLIILVQKIIFKIIGFRINRKVFDFVENDAEFTATNSSRNTLFFILFFGGMTISSLYNLGKLITTLIKGKEISGKEIFIAFIFISIFIFIGIISLRKLLWLLFGFEIITIKNGKMTIKKTGTFWTINREFKLKYIKNVRSKYANDYLLSFSSKKYVKHYIDMLELQKIFLYFTVGEIEFDYKRKRYRLFNDLDIEERSFLIEKIEFYIKHNQTGK